MSIRTAATAIFGLLLAVLGSVIWTSRLDYSPEPQLRERLADRLTEVDPDSFSDLSAQCGEAKNNNGWILFVLNAQLVSDATFRTYFETAEYRVGLWVEYDPGLLRLGLGLGPATAASNIEIPIRWVRSDQRETIMIGVTRNQTRVVANAIDKDAPWPGDLAEIWRCDAVQIGTDTRVLSEGYECSGCNVGLRYATGSDTAELTNLLDSLSNVRSFNTKRIVGSALTLAGALIVLFAPRISARSRRSFPSEFANRVRCEKCT